MVGALIGKSLCIIFERHEVDWTDSPSSQVITLDHPVSVLEIRGFLKNICCQEGVCRRCGAKQERGVVTELQAELVVVQAQQRLEAGVQAALPAGKQVHDQVRFLAPIPHRKSLCGLGIHGVRWTYRQSPQALTLNDSMNDSISALQLRELLYSVCHQDGVCRRCGVTRSRMHHDWGSFGDGDCVRCGEPNLAWAMR